jgi:hypothetical protein
MRSPSWWFRDRSTARSCGTPIASPAASATTHLVALEIGGVNSLFLFPLASAANERWHNPEGLALAGPRGVGLDHAPVARRAPGAGSRA